jgi:cell wall-associated NlpC family hydrolase
MIVPNTAAGVVPCPAQRQGLLRAAFAKGPAVTADIAAAGATPLSGQFALSGPSKVVDPRVTPVRGDLADIALAGKLFAPHYVVPLEKAVALPFVALRKTGSPDAEQTSELLEGERFRVLDLSGEAERAWAWGYGAHDGYLGYLPVAALGDPHDVLLPPADGVDPVAAAEALAGMPYVWGGRGGAGIDCSGLVQTVFARAGYALPRDSDQQRAAAGRLLGEAEPSRRGDLAFFPGHVGIMSDPATLIHASQERGAVVIEPLAEVAARKGGAIIARRRVL